MLWECEGGIGNGVRILIRRGEKTQKKGWGGSKSPWGYSVGGTVSHGPVSSSRIDLGGDWGRIRTEQRMQWECEEGIGNGVRNLIRRGDKTQKKGWGGDQNPLGATATWVPFLTAPFLVSFSPIGLDGD